MWTKIRHAFGPLSLVALCATPALGQEAAQKASPPSATRTAKPAGRQEVIQRTANKPVAGDQSAAHNDQMIAGMLALCNEEEAAVGKLASEHAQHAEVKKFANMMVTEHTQLAKQLQKWAPEATLTDANASGAENATSPMTSFDPMRVHQQIAARSLASAKKSMAAKKGADFDMAYVGSQCVLHQQMIDKATVLRQYASPELQAAIDKGITSAESHLNHAHQLLDTLASTEKADK